MSGWSDVLTTPVGNLLRGRVTGYEPRACRDWHSRLARAELPDSQRRLIEDTVRRTRLWRSEKAEVTDELIAHFQDANEAQEHGRASADATSPVGSFGDPATAARLIRRAKKRNRSLLWHALKWTRRGVALLLVFYAILAVRFFWGEPQINIDYMAKLNTAAMAVPEGQRAWPLYREGLLALGLPEERAEIQNLLTLPQEGEERTAQERQLVAFLQQHQAELATFRRATARSGMGLAAAINSVTDEAAVLYPQQAAASLAEPHSLDTTLIDVLLPQLGDLRLVARLLGRDLRLAAEEGDGARALADAIALFGLAEHASEQPLIINGIVGVSIQTLAFAALGEVLTEQPELWDDRQLVELAHVVSSVPADRLVTLEGERWLLHDLIQRVYSDDGDGDGHLTNEGLRVLDSLGVFLGTNPNVLQEHWDLALPAATYALSPATQLYVASRKEMLDRHRELYDSYILELHVPLWEMPESAAEQRVQAIKEDWQARLKYGLLVRVMPALGDIRRTMQMHENVRARFRITGEVGPAGEGTSPSTGKPVGPFPVTSVVKTLLQIQSILSHTSLSSPDGGTWRGNARSNAGVFFALIHKC